MRRSLTTPDLVVLSLLFEHPMHGYQLVQELERREVRDWAGISRPQVYYSLQKLRAERLLVRFGGASSLGPERQVFRPSAAARRAFAAALDHEEWATQRPPPPFLTWAVLSVQGTKKTAQRLVARRRAFLEEQRAKERATLAAIRRDTGPMVKVAAAIVSLAVAHFELELAWLPQLERALR